MSRLTRVGTAEPVSRDQILRHVRGQGNIHFPCSADHEQDWQPYPVDPYSAICDDHISIHTYILHTNSGCGKERRFLTLLGLGLLAFRQTGLSENSFRFATIFSLKKNFTEKYTKKQEVHS